MWILTSNLFDAYDSFCTGNMSERSAGHNISYGINARDIRLIKLIDFDKTFVHCYAQCLQSNILYIWRYSSSREDDVTRNFLDAIVFSALDFYDQSFAFLFDRLDRRVCQNVHAFLLKYLSKLFGDIFIFSR